MLLLMNSLKIRSKGMKSTAASGLAAEFVDGIPGSEDSDVDQGDEHDSKNNDDDDELANVCRVVQKIVTRESEVENNIPFRC